MLLAGVTTDVATADEVFWVVTGICIFFMALITVLMGYFIFRYRRRGERLGADIHGHLGLEVLWTVVPTIIVLFMFWYGWKGFVQMRTVGKSPLEVSVTGGQWNWAYRYPNGIQIEDKRATKKGAKPEDRFRFVYESGRLKRGEPYKVGEVIRSVLYVPQGRPVKLTLRSVDVIHSYYVSAFRLKEDALPGMETYMAFTAVEPGGYEVLCAEYCGAAPAKDPQSGLWFGHPEMKSEVWVLPPDVFEEWYASKGKKSVIELLRKKAGGDIGRVHPGLDLLRGKQCLSCHTVGGDQAFYPSFKGLFGKKVRVQTGDHVREVTADEAYLRRSILDPDREIVEGYDPGKMQKVAMTDRELAHVIDYLKGLR